MKAILLDGNALMHRSYHAVKFTPFYKGINVGMVFGFGSTLLQTIEKFKPDYFCVAFDTREKTFRHKIDINYKAHREKAPDDFYVQLPYIHKLIEAFQIQKFEAPGFEADDILGTLAKKAEKENLETYILSGDLDFLQLVSDKIYLAKFNGKEPIIFDRDKTYEKLGIFPEQVIDYKAICGDSSDNYKGITGIGPKNGVQLLSKYKTLKTIYKNLDKLKPKIREKFEKDKANAFHCQKLAKISLDVPVDFEFTKNEKFKFSPQPISDFFEKINFFHLKKRTENLNKNIEQGFDIEQKKESKKELNKRQISLF